MSRMLLLALLAALAVSASAVTALAAPADDYAAVRADWRDGGITACRFSETELDNARQVAASNPDDAYSGFLDAVDAELARRRGRACSGRTPDSVRERSRLANLRIVAVRGRGGAASERIVVRNRGRRAVSLRGATLRNSSRSRLEIPGGLAVRGRSTVTLIVGCAPGRRLPSVTGSRAYLCSRRAFLSDRGDVVRLLDSRRLAVSQRGYGNKRRTVAF